MNKTGWISGLDHNRFRTCRIASLMLEFGTMLFKCHTSHHHHTVIQPVPFPGLTALMIG